MEQIPFDHPHVAALEKDRNRSLLGFSGDVYTVAPADLAAAEIEVRLCEQEWRQAGGVQVGESQVDQALRNAKALQGEFNQAEIQSRPGLALIYLYIAHLFFLTGLPRYGKAPVIGGSAAVVCALSMLLQPFVFSSVWSFMVGALALTLFGSCLSTAAVFSLWPSEYKHQSLERLQQEWTQRKERAAALRPGVAQAWCVYEALQQASPLCKRLNKARQKRDALAAILASEKYQLVHKDWRSMRGTDFEDFLSRVFQTLGYQVQLTKASGDQGADLLVLGKGSKIAVQAKGYADTVGNHSVMEVAAGMTFYGCDSCVVITNSRFTTTAIRLAQAIGCRLIDGAQIPDLIEGRIY